MSFPADLRAPPTPWVIEVVLPFGALEPFETELAPFGFACTLFEHGPPPLWAVQVLCAEPPDDAELKTALTVAGAAAGVAAPTVKVSRLPDTDWVAHTNRLLSPVDAGRFHVFGRHCAGMAPPGSWPLLVEAGQAFGTGRAPSTLGCLLAIDALRKRRRFRRVLDLGTGSGILAMAAGRAWPARIVASDIDPVAAQVATDNVRQNGLAARVNVRHAPGLRDRRIAAGAPYDLIMANILARPLASLAVPLSRLLAPGGTLVLSGLLGRDEREVLARYRLRGLALDRRIALQGWHTLLLRSRSRCGIGE